MPLYTTLLKANVLNFCLTLDLLQSDCSDLVSKWRGHTVATTFLLRGHCLTCAGFSETIFFQHGRHLDVSARDTVAFLERDRDARNASSSIGACVRVCGAHFEHEFWQFWAHLSWQLITLLNKPYSVYCVLIQSSDTSLQIIHFNVITTEKICVSQNKAAPLVK